MKLYIFYDLHDFINILDNDRIGNFEQYNIFKSKKFGHVFTFCDLHYAFSKQFYKVQNDYDYKFTSFIEQKTYDLKRIKNIKNPAKQLKKQVLTKMYNVAKKDAGSKQRVRVCFMKYQDYCEIADTFFTKEEIVKLKLKIKV